MIIVLDSSALINNPSFSFEKGDSYLMAPSAFAELKDFKARVMAEQALEQGSLKLINPESRYLEKIKKAGSKAGVLQELSFPDIETLAVALQEKKTLLSDDYDIQNLARILGLKAKGAVYGEIRHKRKYFYFCPVCRKKLKKGELCSNCGKKAVSRGRIIP